MKELIYIQSNLKAPKNQWNDFGKYSYRNAENILEAVKPLLSEKGCTLTISDEIVQFGDRVYVKATATIKNSSNEAESATAFAREPLSKKGQDESQVTGSASSYARKYALNGLFAIDDNKDADALNVTPEYTQQQPSQPAQPVQTVASPYLSAVKGAKTKEELETIWHKFPQLQSDKTFIDVISLRKQELENAKH